MSTTNEMLLDRMFAGWSAQDVAQILECFVDDCVYEDRATGTISRGKDALKGFASRGFAAQPDFHVEFTKRFATETHGAGEWVLTSTWKGEFEGVEATGRKTKISGVSLYEFRDGKISHACDCWNHAQRMKQLGILSRELAELI